MSLFNELKRRNVFRVSVAYLVGAWLLIQVADILLDNIGAPAWVLQTLFVILAVGFFVSAFVAWAFELTPEGVKREKDIDRDQSITPQTGKKLNNTILILMAIAISYLLFDKVSAPARPASESLSQATAEQSTGATEKITPAPVEAGQIEPAISKQSIAVLPFDNRSPDANDAYFTAGIHDDLLTNLARIGSLKVISRTSVSKYADTEKTIPEIAAELNVATIMEGAVQRAGNTVRINVQLIDAQTDEHLWAEIFDRELTTDNLFAIQTEISEAIAKALHTKLSPQEQQRIADRPTQDLAAYSAYLRGRQLMTLRTSTSLDQAAEEFQRAIELDPEFALAWVSVAETANLRVEYGALPPEEAQQQQKAAVEKALALNDQLGEAFLSQASVLDYQGQLPEAEAAYLKAIDLSPGYASAWHWYGNFVSSNYPHRRKEALGLLKKAMELDPMSSIIGAATGRVYRQLGRYAEAEAYLLKVIEQDPGFAPTYTQMAYVQADIGHFDQRIMWLEKSLSLDTGRLLQQVNLQWAYMDIGDADAVREIRDRVMQRDEDHPWISFLGGVYAMYVDNYPAALEQIKSFGQQQPSNPFPYRINGYLYTLMRDYAQARASFELSDPAFFDHSTWRSGIEEDPVQGCRTAWVLMQTGDAAMGAELLTATLSYLEDELPAYIEHADRFGTEWCYVVRGDIDKALAVIETQVEHGHIQGWYFWRKHPEMEPLWGTPRFEAAMQRVAEELARQRENLSRMKAEAGL
jgi:TolB-like protein/Tfp pilus assembly protein PilF